MIEDIVAKEDSQKQDIFIDKTKIEPDKKITPPEGARYFRFIKGFVNFYNSVPEGSRNHYQKLPEAVKSMQLPHYKIHKHNISYGDAVFE